MTVGKQITAIRYAEILTQVTLAPVTPATACLVMDIAVMVKIIIIYIMMITISYPITFRC